MSGTERLHGRRSDPPGAGALSRGPGTQAVGTCIVGCRQPGASLHPCEISERRVGSCGTHPFRFLTEEKLQPKLFIVNT
ncbi:hypothetical protein PERCYII40_0676 [Pseudomonas aeruginosa]|nr:hypothetical protein PERCYII40_0676 [Pseudomonas aeruginosa]